MSTNRVVAGRYDLVRPLGRGGAAVVYVAQPREGGEAVALKLIPARPRLTPAEVQVFEEAVQVAARVDHPSVLRPLEVGHDAEAEVLFIAMTLLHGETLRELIGRTAADTEAARIDALEAALEPLEAAHLAGAVHGDLSPTSVFSSRSLSGPRRVVLLDFGLTAALQAGNLAAPGARVGRLRYRAPEQLSGEVGGPAADVWAFGVMLYEALVGRPPFDFDDPRELWRNAHGVPHAPLDDVAPGVDAGMARVVDMCLQKDARSRPESARVLRRFVKTMRGAAAAMRGGRGGAIPLDTIMDMGGSAPAPAPDALDEALRRAPRDPEVHRALLTHYEGEGVTDGAWLAAAALEFLGEANRAEARLFRHYRRPVALEPDRGVDSMGWAALLHEDQDPRVDAVWAEVAEAVASLHRRPDAELGLGEAAKLDLGRPKEPLAARFARAVATLRPGVLPRLYRNTKVEPAHHLPAWPPASIFPRDFEEPLPAGALAFAVARHVAFYRHSHRVCAYLHEPEALERLFVAALDVGLARAPDDPARARMAELLDGQLDPPAREGLRVACARLGTSADRVDLGTWRRAVELSCARAGLLLSGDLEGAAWMLRWSRERRRIPPEDATDDLLAFWSSGSHVHLRHLLGVALPSA